jgi:predicted phage terminase large subunit-like protein
MYLASSADITAFGGAAGGGKTLGTLLRFAVHADRHPGYYGAIFRREMPMVLAGGGLWEESMQLYPIWGAKPNLTTHDWRFPRGRSLVQFRSLQHSKDVLAYQGAQFAEFCLEEATHFEESQFWYLISRLRSNCGMKPRACLTFNPDPDSWVRKLIDWWIGPDGFVIHERAGKKRYFVRDGDELVWGNSVDECRSLAPHVKSEPKSLRFIPSMLSDNPKIDPTYEERLNSLPLVERERLKGGNWNIRAAAGTVFKRQWFEVIDHVPNDMIAIGRYWDLAATEPNVNSPDPDWTRGVKLSIHRSGLIVIHHVVSLRGRPAAVSDLVRTTAQQDGRACTQGFWQDPGAAGKADVERYRMMLAGHIVKVVRAAHDKVTYAKATSSQAEGGNVKLLRGPWNDAYLAEHEAFPDGKHDDIVDAESLGVLDLTSGVPTQALHITGL